MKFFLKFFAFVFLILGLFVVGYWISAKKGGWGASLSESLQATPMEKESKGNENQSALNRAASQEPDYAEAARRAAMASNVEIVSFSDNQSHQIVKLRWEGDVATRGGDFLEFLRRQGRLANFEETAKPAVSRGPGGERFYTAYYTLYMK